MRAKKISTWIIGVFTTVFSGLLFLIHVSEFINVAFLKEIENYPFGCECINKFSYKSAKHYSVASVLYSIIFLGISLLTCKSTIKRKTKIILMTTLLLIITFICQFYI